MKDLLIPSFTTTMKNQMKRKPLCSVKLAVTPISTPSFNPQWPLVTNMVKLKWNSASCPNTAMSNDKSLSLPISPAWTPLSPSGLLFNKQGQSSSQQNRGVSPTTVPIDFAENVNCTILSLTEQIRIMQFTKPVPRIFSRYSSNGPIHTITQSESDDVQ